MGLEPTLARILPPPISRPAPSDAASPAEVQVRAQAEVNAASRSVRGSGELDALKYGRILRPGLPALIRGAGRRDSGLYRSEEHTSELQSLMRISYAVFCLKKKKQHSTKSTKILKIQK